MPRAGGKRSWVKAMAAFAIGSGISSASLGMVVATISAVILPSHFSHPGLIITWLLGVGLAVNDLVRPSRWGLGIRRQTDPRWRRTLGLRWAAALWGLDLGLGFTTFRVTSISWLLLAIVAVEHSMLAGAIVFVGYSIGQTAAILWGQRVAVACDIRPLLNPTLTRRMRVTGSAAIVAWCAIAAILVGL